MLVNDAYKTGDSIGEIAAMVTESEAFGLPLTTQLYVWQVRYVPVLMRVSWNKRSFQMLKKD